MKKVKWAYSQKVKEHFFNPCNFIKGNKPDFEFNGVGAVGSPACGDVMKFWVYIEPKTKIIKNIGWQTFGCASAIAATSILSKMAKGKKIEKALKIKPQNILKKLGGLPHLKIHCSILGDQALKKAIEDYKNNTKYS